MLVAQAGYEGIPIVSAFIDVALAVAFVVATAQTRPVAERRQLLASR